MTDKLLPASEVAEMIGLSIRTVQDMMQRRELPYCQVTRSRRMVPSGELAKWIKQNTVSVDPESMVSRQASGMSSGDREAASVAGLQERATDTLPRDG